MQIPRPHVAVAASMFLLSFGLVVFELALTRLFGVILFASFAHLALALAMLGISLGAVLQHMWPGLMPAQGLERRLGWASLLQGLTTLLAVLASVLLPVTTQFEQAPVHFGERSSIAWDLLDPLWFSVLMPILALPFVVVGLSFAGAFQRRKEHIGLIYGADLMGGALGALAFVPILTRLSAPDSVGVVMLSTAVSGAFLAWTCRDGRLGGASGLMALSALGMICWSLSGHEIMKIRYAAGYSEEHVTYTRWTPLTRLAIHEDERGIYMLLDNTSASEVITTEEARRRKSREAARGFVYSLYEPGARIAILAASAGPEVAAAQAFGHTDIEAIDIAAEIGDIVAARWPDSPVNPYVIGDTRRVWSDGRSAILHAEEPYDIIHMVHANLHSSAGLLATAWSPNLLETTEAFHTYLDHLSDDGTLCFAAHHHTRHFVRTVAQTLRERGVERPGDYILYVTGDQIFMLVKKHPWTTAQRDQVEAGLASGWGKEEILLDPVFRDLGLQRKYLRRGLYMTDNRPYFESPGDFRRSIARVFRRLLGQGGEEAHAVDIIYNSLVLQALFVLLAGSLLLVGPLLRRGPVGLLDVRGAGSGLIYVSCLGYGYLAVETVLIHELILYVGHPTYAVTVVIFSMLLFSGLGSILAGRLKAEHLVGKLRVVLVLVLLLGVVQAWGIPWFLTRYALGLPMLTRAVLTALVLAPLGLVMGMPFPLALRVLRPEAAGLVPWAWAFNGWTSVVASLTTVFVSRLLGYDQALAIAFFAYLVAALLAGRLARIHKGVAGPAGEAA